MLLTQSFLLRETSNKALTSINNANLTPFLMAFLTNRDKIPVNAAVAAAQCLYVLSDDNDPVINAIKKNQEYISCLLGIVNSTTSNEIGDGDGMKVDEPIDDERMTMLKVLACGMFSLFCILRLSHVI